MSYTATLRVLARLQIDLAFRQSFLADPAAALDSAELNEQERRALQLLPRRTVERFGAMADQHRIMRIAEYLPWLDTAARPALVPLLVSYQAAVPPQLLNRLEAIAFCLHVEKIHESQPPYLSELARYERLRIEISWELESSHGGTRTEFFHYPIDQLRAALVAPGWPAASPAPTRLMFRKVPGLPAVLVRPA